MYVIGYISAPWNNRCQYVLYALGHVLHAPSFPPHILRLGANPWSRAGGVAARRKLLLRRRGAEAQSAVFRKEGRERGHFGSHLLSILSIEGYCNFLDFIVTALVIRLIVLDVGHCKRLVRRKCVHVVRKYSSSEDYRHDRKLTFVTTTKTWSHLCFLYILYLWLHVHVHIVHRHLDLTQNFKTCSKGLCKRR